MMDGTPRVSVIIRTYNRAALLTEAIESVLSQTFTHVEILVVDGGSTDSTRQLLGGYGERVRALYVGRGVNLAGAINLGLEAARGDLIAFLDSDDLWLPEKLELQVTRLLSEDRFGFSYTNCRLLYPDGSLSDPALAPDQIVAGPILQTVVRNMCIKLSTALIRTSLIRQLGPLDESYFACEEYPYCLRLAQASEAVCLPEPLSLIRQHSDQASRTISSVAIYEATVRALEDLLRSPSLDRRVRLEARRSLARYHGHLAHTLLATGRPAEARQHVARALQRYPLHRPAWRLALRSLLSSAV
jgi:glycosyltransferase involved in cell wall biosynthesis